MTLRLEVSDWESVLICVTASKSLISHIEERIVLLLFNNLADLLPLFLGWVNASGVVSTSVEENDTAFRSCPEIRDHSIEVQTNSVFIVVSVFHNLESRVFENSIVICPAGSRYKNLLSRRVEACKEFAPYAKCACAGDRLCDCNAVVLDRIRCRAIGKDGSCLGEGRYACDTGIFLVEIGPNDFLLGRFD